MSEKQPKKLQAWTPLLFAIVMVLGMAIGFRMKESLRYKRDINTAVQRNDRLEEIIDLIDEKYVDTVNNNLLYRDAVNGILTHLDPHTVYIPVDELEGVNETLEGSFGGIGVGYNIFRDTIIVTSVIEKGPAEKAGIEVGDKFVKVDNTLVAGRNITVDTIKKLLRGKANTSVILTLRDAVTGNNKIATVTRGAIPIYSIDASVMLDNETGFIKINRFSATTFDEFMEAMRKLQQAGMKQLILDLRGNPGGYLEAATKIADQFLDGKKMIVYTAGRKSKKENFLAGDPGLFEEGKLIVLVDESSASASEILSGAIQDWDRGVIVGRKSFGKGLVQEQYDLGDGSALRLTIAKYYTPSGRSIQRSFAQGKDAYEADYEARFKNGELTGKDSLAMQDTAKYYTANHRVVYGGGGIKPDIYVPYDTSRLSSGLLKLVFSDEVQNVLWDYYTANKNELKKYGSVKNFETQFTNTGVLINSYLQSLNTFNRAAALRILSSPANRSYMELQLKAQLARILYKDNGYYYVYSRGDNVIQKSLQTFQNGSYSKIIGR